MRILWWLLAVTWMVLIFWLSASPDARGGSSLLELIPFGDKVAHGIAFGVLGALLYLATGSVWSALLGASLYGLSDELHQMYVSGRSADMRDWLADTIGALIFILGVKYLTQTFKRARKTLQ